MLCCLSFGNAHLSNPLLKGRHKFVTSIVVPMRQYPRDYFFKCIISCNAHCPGSSVFLYEPLEATPYTMNLIFCFRCFVDNIHSFDVILFIDWPAQSHGVWIWWGIFPARDFAPHSKDYVINSQGAHPPLVIMKDEERFENLWTRDKIGRVCAYCFVMGFTQLSLAKPVPVRHEPSESCLGNTQPSEKRRGSLYRASLHKWGISPSFTRVCAVVPHLPGTLRIPWCNWIVTRDSNSVCRTGGLERPRLSMKKEYFNGCIA